MALTKQPVAINFARGLDTKSDPYQVQVGNFLTLVNSVFTATGRLTKRNGYKTVTQLPDANQTVLTTLNDNLIATGSNLYSFSENTNQWLNKGTVQPVSLSTQPLLRSSTSQTSPDMALASNNLGCLVYVDNGLAYYQISDTITGEQVINRTALPATAVSPRAFILGPYFIITFIDTVSGGSHLQYIAIPVQSPGIPRAPADLSSNVASLTAGYDAYSIGTRLFFAWSNGSGGVSVTYLNQSLDIATPTVIAGTPATIVSVTVDSSVQKVWTSFWDTSSTNGFTAAFNYNLVPLVSKTQIVTTTVLNEMTSIAFSNTVTVFYETAHTYGSGVCNNAVTDFVSSIVVTPPVSGTGAGTVGAPAVILRSVGLASKAFMSDLGIVYMMVAYGDTAQSPSTNDSNQPTYFLIDSLGHIYMRLAYSNGGGYAVNKVLPSVSLLNDTYYVPYLNNDFLASVNKGTNLPAGTPTAAIYTQTGINLAQFAINNSQQHSSQIAGALHLTGGQLWEYDGVKPVEHGFQVWPENVEATWSTTGGDIVAIPVSGGSNTNAYYYSFTYEWTDNAGNLHRSAPSIPTPVTTTGMGTTGSVVLTVPTLRLTYKIAPNPVRIVGYRWSQGQQVYYQFTSLTSPVINNPAVDNMSITDTFSDAEILGNVLLYTTGGVIEDIAAPASIDSALFNNRLFLIDAEDRNLLWFSKQVIEATPVEMSDLLTIYVAPTTGSQGSTGPMTALSAMDDKLIIFKENAIYYINGIGPDNTGANSTFSDPVFVSSAVGCQNPNSIVLIPNGLMFQSDKGIWLLGRDLSTNYIGAPVEQFNNYVVSSATVIPGTNQARFILNNNTTLVYDFYFNQWSTHTNISAISATLYQNDHTYLNSFGQVYQEAVNTYTDGSVPVLMSLTTSWMNVAGLQGFERFYFGNLLGTYFTPFKLNVQLAYDYNASATQNIIIQPNNFTPAWGGEAQWGSGQPWGGPGNVFSARFFPVKQKCQSFQVSLQEIYDASLGVAPGAGLTLSGLALIVGVKRGYRTQSAAKSFG